MFGDFQKPVCAYCGELFPGSRINDFADGRAESEEGVEARARGVDRAGAANKPEAVVEQRRGAV